MGVRDKNIDYIRHREYIPVHHMTGWLTYATSGVSMDGSGVLAEANDAGTALNVMGAPMAANDDIHHHMIFPTYWDIEKEIGVRVVWVNDADMAGAGGFLTYLVSYTQHDFGENLTADATTQLDTAITVNSIAANDATAGVLQRTSRGIINGGTFDENAYDGILHWKITLSNLGLDLANDEAHTLGLLIDYYPKLTLGGFYTSVEDRI